VKAADSWLLIAALILAGLSFLLSLTAFIRTGRVNREAERDQLLKSLHENATIHRVTAERLTAVQRSLPRLSDELRKTYEPGIEEFLQQAVQMANENEELARVVRDARFVSTSRIRFWRRRSEAARARTASVTEQHGHVERMVLKSLSERE
jgi:hypothetical protein